MTEPNKAYKPFARDLVVYMVTSVRLLLCKGLFGLFVKDVFSFLHWRVFRVSSKSTIDYKIPWMSFAAIDYLRNWLKKEMVVFEYGSGGSSLFIAERVKQLHSVDHDKVWYNKVNDLIRQSQISNIDYSFYGPEPVISPSQPDCGNPDNYLSCMGEFRQLNFEAYAKSIDRFPDNYFDLVIVDGRARPSCIKHSIGKVKPGGILLLDNSDRGYYLKSFPQLFDIKKWKRKTFEGHTPFGLTSVLYSTTFFVKK